MFVDLKVDKVEGSDESKLKFIDLQAIRCENRVKISWD